MYMEKCKIIEVKGKINHQLFLVSLRVKKNLNIHLDIPRVYEKKDSSQQGRLHAKRVFEGFPPYSLPPPVPLLDNPLGGITHE